jgi:SM-20-related protein
MATPPSLIDLDVIARATVFRDPYTYLVANNFLRPEAVGSLRQDFPLITKPGFLTVDDVVLSGRFKQLIEELEGPELTELLSNKFGRDLKPHPRLTTVRKFSQLKDGRIHTDGESKLATFLVYMNDEWSDDRAGRLRVLRGPADFDDMAAEISPVMGSAFGFLRSDNSWHGHKPFAGERRVVQVTWLRDAADLQRKKSRNTAAKFLKGIFGR